jgi:hypothetical protein
MVSLEELNAWGNGYLPGWLGFEVLAAEPGKLRSRMTIRPEFLAPNGYLHAASIVALADTACGFGTRVDLPEGAKGFTTIELKSNFLGYRDGRYPLMRSDAPASWPHHAGLGRDGNSRAERQDTGPFPVYADHPLPANIARACVRPASSHRSAFASLQYSDSIGDPSRPGGSSTVMRGPAGVSGGFGASVRNACTHVCSTDPGIRGSTFTTTISVAPISHAAQTGAA